MLFTTSTDGYFYALDQQTGAIAWRVRLNNLLTDATPALEGQVLFVAAHGTALEALNAYTGQVYWTVETGEKIQAPPLVVGRPRACRYASVSLDAGCRERAGPLEISSRRGWLADDGQPCRQRKRGLCRSWHE